MIVATLLNQTRRAYMMVDSGAAYCCITPEIARLLGYDLRRPMARRSIASAQGIVAYDTGAITDWIEDGVNGLLIELGKPEQFFQALRRLLTEPHALNQLRNNAWARTANLAFNSWDQTYRDFLQALDV